MDNLGRIFEQFKVHANELGTKISELIHEGNVRRIIIRDEHGHTFMEIPLTVATVGAVLAPVLAAVGAIAALVTHVTVVVERNTPPSGGAGGTSAAHAGAGPTDASVGATENKTDLRDTVPQRVDRRGTKIEDLAGTGQHDAPGG
jgi:hypothetical protein